MYTNTYMFSNTNEIRMNMFNVELVVGEMYKKTTRHSNDRENYSNDDMKIW